MNSLQCLIRILYLIFIWTFPSPYLMMIYVWEGPSLIRPSSHIFHVIINTSWGDSLLKVNAFTSGDPCVWGRSSSSSPLLITLAWHFNHQQYLHQAITICQTANRIKSNEVGLHFAHRGTSADLSSSCLVVFWVKTKEIVGKLNSWVITKIHLNLSELDIIK